MEKLTGASRSIRFKGHRSDNVGVTKALALVDIVDTKLAQVLS